MVSLAPKVRSLRDNIGKALFGKDDVAELAIISLLCEGHLLIEDVPGVGKTTLARALAGSIAGTFKRIQFTSDMLPSDILGVSIYDQDRKNFIFRPGPLFANIVLADEINRATPKTQSALLEAMNERRVTLDNNTHPLPVPFLVLATENPVEYHGTFPLPESQMDRFFMRIRVGYPSLSDERRILTDLKGSEALDSLEPVLSAGDIAEMTAAVDRTEMNGSVLDYLLAIVTETRNCEAFHVGVSPRGSQALHRAARAAAVMEGRTFCIPDDVKRLALSVLPHRIILKRRHTRLHDQREESENAIRDVLERVPVPV